MTLLETISGVTSKKSNTDCYHLLNLYDADAVGRRWSGISLEMLSLVQLTHKIYAKGSTSLLFLALAKEFHHHYIIQSCQDPRDVQHGGAGVVGLHGDLPQVQQSPASLLQ